MYEVYDAFLELKYGRIYSLDLHGKTKEEALSEIVYTLNRLDNTYKGVLVIHGYHKGTVLKKFIRENFTHKSITAKINIDASRTLLLVNMEK